MTIEKSIEYFLLSLGQMQLSKHTLRAYKQDLEQWLRCVQKSTLDDLGFEDFQEYLIVLQSLNLKPTSLRRKRVVVHRYLKYCYEKKLTSQQLYDYIDPIKAKKHKVPKEVLAQQEINDIFEFLDSEIEDHYKTLGNSNYADFRHYCAIRNRLIIKILLYTGCRAAEVVSLKNQDINIQQNTMTILAKGHKYNVIPLHTELLDAIDLYEKQCKQIKNIAILKMLEDSEYIFPSKKTPAYSITTRTLHDLMIKLSKELERHIHAHLFRHTFASYCIAANMDISTISSLISHSNPSITLSIYTHEIESNQKQKEIKKLSFELN